MPTAYVYIRVSHDDSAKSALSPGSQLDICKAHYRARGLAEQGVEWWGLEEIPEDLDLTKHQNGIPLLYDAAVSARHVPFLSRKSGLRLHHMLEPGDHVLFAYLDRAFRALLDFTALVDVWKTKGVVVHFCDFGADLSTSHGMFVANMMATFAQWQSDVISDRCKATSNRLKKLGRACGGRRSMGYQLVRRGQTPEHPKGTLFLDRDEEELAIMAETFRMRESGHTYTEISDTIETRLAKFEGRRYQKYAPFRKWPPVRCRHACVAYKKLREWERDNRGEDGDTGAKP